MSNKHTQGQWVGLNAKTKKFGSFHGWRADNETASSTMAAPINAGRETIAMVVTDDWERKEEMHANARLIAAAPELLAALSQIERLSREADGGLVDVRAMLGDIARSAISKATGNN